ncbi:cupin domain-containing protein [Roseibium litorale]|uniref:Cupin domain-containing protein n=1 Tax=Roseibium litorale TaxID=2803841 RepID=A0ABR9CGL8_9HYPH|nr:cupin domain-containing protein [Roseibium litorale]MBD8890030.1 cupin domain-containing protein [Roseibium litorale]
MLSFFQPVDIEGIEPEHETPAPEKVLAGDPQFTTWLCETRDDERQFTGIWQSTPGKWAVSYDEWEFCTILSGVSILTDETGAERTLRANDSFIIHPGFKGTWEVVETTRKIFVIRL